MRYFRFILMCLVLVATAVCPAVTFAAGGNGDHVHIGTSPEDEKSGLEEARADLAIYSFVVFVLLVLVLYKFAFGPISKALDARESGIRQDIEDAKNERLKAEELRGEYDGLLQAAEDKVRDIHAEAHAKAEALSAERVAQAEQEAEAQKRQAIVEIGRAKDQAVQELFEAMSARVADATEHVLGRSLNDEDQSRLIDEALSSLSQQKS